MAAFKAYARQVLGRVEREGEPQIPEPSVITNIDYQTEQNVDIVTAYKELKMTLGKSTANRVQTTAPGGTRGYLKTTITMQQHSKNRMNKELLKYSLDKKRKSTPNL